MSKRGAHHVVRTNLVVGVQCDDFDYRLFLKEYHRDLKTRFPSEDFPAYAPNVVLESLINQYEAPVAGTTAGYRYDVLKAFAHRAHRLDLAMTASDFGPFEQRRSPYSFDRAYYHLGRIICSARVKMEFPGYNPYRSTRKWDLDFVRNNLEDVFEILPDYLWWSLHDQKDAIENALMVEQLDEVRRKIEASGYKTVNFGLYLTTLETLHLEEEEIPD